MLRSRIEMTRQPQERPAIYVLASNAMNLRITPLVDGRVGVHALVPKAIFKRQAVRSRKHPGSRWHPS
jgi:acetamidase/formamidase